jgi:acyl-CoA thioester hydrolase
MTAAAPFFWQSRVYWEDTDASGVVYYANYLRYMERARTEWLRQRGWSQQQLAIDPGILFTVANVNIDYLKPAKLDDALWVSCAPEPEGRVTLAFVEQIRRDSAGGDVLINARVRVACVDAIRFRPRRLPDFVLEVVA